MLNSLLSCPSQQQAKRGNSLLSLTTQPTCLTLVEGLWLGQQALSPQQVPVELAQRRQHLEAPDPCLGLCHTCIHSGAVLAAVMVPDEGRRWPARRAAEALSGVSLRSQLCKPPVAIEKAAVQACIECA